MDRNVITTSSREIKMAKKDVQNTKAIMAEETRVQKRHKPYVFVRMKIDKKCIRPIITAYGSDVDSLESTKLEKPLVLTVQDEENRSFLQDRNNEGVIDDLVTVLRVVWNNYNIGQLIYVVQQPTQECRESLEGTI